MGDHDQSETDDPTEESSGPEHAADESDPLESTTVEETDAAKRTRPTDSDSTFAGRNAVRTAGLIAGFGTLIFWAPILFTGFGMVMWLQLGIGFTIALAGSLTAMWDGKNSLSAVGLPALAAVLALVAAALPFIWDMNSEALRWSNVVVGLIVVVLAVLTIVGFRKDAEARSGSDRQHTGRSAAH